ncbi:cobalamin B12-binding domain-containing protein [Algirhabdus cladophorae]|uniref:cobalamin B12-binding domain-containing protein n=1 Tax=Algirhabdus cladophorae TaxID=3377108 RepID=UPI003B84ACDD
MTDGPKTARSPAFGFDPQKVDALATGVLSIVASQKTANMAAPSQELVDMLCTAVKEFDPDAQQRALDHMLSAGVTPAAMIDDYIPLAAHQLGTEWCEDSVSFADVTIGTARLQAMLRELSNDFYADLAADPTAPNVLLVVLSDEYHTLGAMVASNQLRRQGVSVRLKLGQSKHDVAQELRERDYDLFMISASCGENLELVRDIVKTARQAMNNAAPIALGGSIVQLKANLRALTGADVVTTDTKEALRLCALKVQTRGGASLQSSR